MCSEVEKELRESRELYYKSLYYLLKRLGGKAVIPNSEMLPNPDWGYVDIIIYPNDTLTGTVVEILEERGAEDKR